tara:strand:+ start:314 stop:673 length:360 start_codon:yes stop_codon:yes gene_type:complete
MSSNIEIIRICEYCHNEFIAKTTVTKYCSHKCNSRAYKERIKYKKIKRSNEETYNTKTQAIEIIKAKEFLTVKDITILINCSRQTIYKIIHSGKLKSIDLKIKKIIVKRSDLDRLFKNE